MSITQTEEIQFVNIITIEQSKLQKNFRLIASRLNDHQIVMADQNASLRELQAKTQSKIKSSEKMVIDKITELYEQITSLKKKLGEFDQVQTQIKGQVNLHELNISKVKEQMIVNKLQQEQSLDIVKAQIQNQNRITETIQQQIAKLDDDIKVKQSKIEVEKLIKEIDRVKQINAKIQNDLKLSQHKIEKLQIFNEKAERLQPKKDAEFLKEIDSRISKEVKVVIGKVASNSNSTPSNTSRGSEIPKLKSATGQQAIFYDSSKRESIQMKKGFMFKMQEQDSKIQMLKMNMEHPITKLNEKIKTIQRLYNQTQEQIRQMQETLKKQKGSPEGIKEKINEIKPQLIKLWAKCDTLDDRMSYNEKRIEDKSKILTELVNQQKENSWGKIQEKIKLLQTQFYASFKDFTLKLQGKVNLTDYEKYCRSMDEKVKQINDAIYLKSDKLQVKKALLFLESKIKEIILVISQDEQNEKDALLTKKQIKCISCDKQVEKHTGTISGVKGNWDSMPWKDHPPEILGRFGMTNYGSLSKKLKKLQNPDLPILKKKHNNSMLANRNSNNQNINPLSP